MWPATAPLTKLEIYLFDNPNGSIIQLRTISSILAPTGDKVLLTVF